LMTKKEIVRKIASSMEVSQDVVHEVVQRTFDEIVDALVRDTRIELRNFGVFEVRVRAPRKARNPRTNAWLTVPQRAAVVFKPGKAMADRVAALPLDELNRRLREALAAPPDDTDVASGGRPDAGPDERPGEFARPDR